MKILWQCIFPGHVRFFVLFSDICNVLGSCRDEEQSSDIKLRRKIERLKQTTL